jgi:peptide-methionine (S)-S-oxide reductase
MEIPLPEPHMLTGRPLREIPAAHEQLFVAMGCFWGAERRFWQQVSAGEWALRPGIWSTSVGYAGGHTPNASYREVCSGQTGHTEVVQLVYDPTQVTIVDLLRIFWEGHDPTQGMRQGNDIGTQYRSAIYATTSAQLQAAQQSRNAYAAALKQAGKNPITTEIAMAGPYYFAEQYHQQYLARNPDGYCGLGDTGVSCPVGLGVA